MKINRIQNSNYKLFKYNLLKLQVYSNNSNLNVLNFTNNLLEQIETYLKQILKLIYKYHIYRFKILFIGFPVASLKKQQIKLIHFTNHNFISEKFWINGIIRNRFSIMTYLKLIQSQNFLLNLKLLLTIKTKPHLVVIFNSKLEINAINEFYKAGIPILVFNWSLIKSIKVSYQALGNFRFSENTTKLTFFFLLYSLLKKIPTKQTKKL